jgi:hypothetical protein
MQGSSRMAFFPEHIRSDHANESLILCKEDNHRLLAVSLGVHGPPFSLACTQTGVLGRSGLGGIKQKPAGGTEAETLSIPRSR